MLGKDLKLSLSSLLTSPGAVDFPTNSPHRIFFPKKKFFPFPFSPLSVTHAVPSDGLWFRPFVLEKRTHSRTEVYKLDSCPSLGLATPELLASEPNHFCILWALISFSEKEEETTGLKTT